MEKRTDGIDAIELPEAVRAIIAALEASGFEAYAVGGCVRDSLLGLTPKDWDINTSALPEETKACFKQCRIIETGSKYGTVALMFDDRLYEVTTYRADGKYKDRRRPDTVRFVNVLKRDLARRDFTVNAMAYHPKTGLTDYYGGRQDLAEKKIKCVGNPDKRFGEDALRIMRALRFASVMGFSVEEGTSAAIFRNMEALDAISAERLTDELLKLTAGDGYARILSEYKPVLIKALPELIPDKKHITRRLKKTDAETLRRLFEIKNDGAAAAVLDEIMARRSFSLKDLSINGKDLLAAGVPQGVQMGKILNRLMEMVTDGRLQNDRAELLGAVPALNNQNNAK
jgi:tRNA nucleotidyltransferase/poly(A) polymerase